MHFEDFTHLYQRSITLRMELKPIGCTLDNLKKNRLIEKDEHRADNFKMMKDLIDEYYKDSIEKALLRFGSSNHIAWNTHIEEYDNLYHSERTKNMNKEDSKKQFVKIQRALREDISKALKDKTKSLFGKNLIKKELLPFLNTHMENKDRIHDYTKLVKEFERFNTYFTGFFQNRENIFSSEEKHSSVSYRIINENLPKFIDNIDTYEKLSSVQEMTEIQENLYQTFKDIFLN